MAVSPGSQNALAAPLPQRPTAPPVLSAPTDFPTQVLPILTRSGCNTGACHGAATGQGGFRLSLLGYDPEADYATITREQQGRRIDRLQPDESLVLRKATLRAPHAGGLRFPVGSPFHKQLKSWVSRGAPYGSTGRQVLRVEPSRAEILSSPGVTASLSVRAHYSDGTSEDVTRLALFSSNDDALVSVTPEGAASIQRRGMTSIMVRYLGEVAAIRIGSPFGSTTVDPKSFPPRNEVDRKVFAELGRLRLPPSPLSSDAEFLRRVTLDLTGLLPTETETRAFLSSGVSGQLSALAARTGGAAGNPVSGQSEQRATGDRQRAAGNGQLSTSRRVALIDSLLQRPEFVDLWTHLLAELMQLDSGRLGLEPARAYHRWLREQVAKNRPWSEMVATLVAASGDPSRIGPANFYRVATDPRDMGEFVSRTLLGVRVQCARCHSHPYDRWTQNDYHRFAAFFARVRYEGGSVVVSERGDVLHPKTGAAVEAAPLVPLPASARATGYGLRAAGGGIAGIQVAGGAVDRRLALRDWLVSPENPFVARAFVNRVWKRLMGRGIVEPVDDLRATNPPSNPALLELLASDFIRTGYDIRLLIRTIVTSRTYQLTSRAVPANRVDDRFFSHAYLKPLPAEVFADAIAQATGIPDAYTNQPPGTRATQLLDARVPSVALDVFGRCLRDTACETSGRAGGGLSQALHLINDEELNRKVRDGVVAQLMKRQSPGVEIVDTLYLRALSRHPSPAERGHWEPMMRDAASRRETSEDLLWALLNSREFGFNH